VPETPTGGPHTPVLRSWKTAFEARLAINGVTTIAGVAAPAGSSAQIYDAPTTIPNTQICVVQVLHAAGANKAFTGTLLGS
jgi:hypothetical protein